MFCISFIGIAKAQTIISDSDSAKAKNIALTKNDSLKIKKDTTKKDTTKKSDFALSSKVDYKAKDSIRFDIKEEKAYLYGKAEIKYEDIDLTAEYIEISFKVNQLFAKGVLDSTGKLVGKPVFKQGAESFTSTTLTYNFKTKKGFIAGIFTKEGDSYLQGKTVKKFPDNSINVKNGLYTTCDLDHPHYEIKFNKARVMPNDKIVSGPAYLVIEDVPTPIALPFGFFPNKQGQKSGIIIPTYGESDSRGFFLSNGGYYFGLGQYMDLSLKGDIYSHGSWNIDPTLNYTERYKYAGNLSFGYSTTIDGVKGTTDYQKAHDFFIRWSHRQDPKAHPNSTFSASVNSGSAGYDNHNLSSSANFLTNQLNSAVSYTTVIDDNYNFSVSMSSDQSRITHVVDLGLPQIAFSVNRFYPFRNENRVGKATWYDNISVGYTMDAKNSINTFDSLLFRKNTLKQMQNGMYHNIPISSSIPVLKNFTWNNTINYNERWYLQTIRKHWVKDTLITGGDTTVHYLKTDTVQGFRAERDFSFTSSLSTIIYGMYQFKNCKIIAIRHIFTPSISFTYTPDFGSPSWNYYRYSINQSMPTQKPLRYYSIFDGDIYGSPPANKSGVVGFSLDNRLDMKVRSKKDTVNGIKKIVLIEDFKISTGYDVAKDSNNWSNLSMQGRTRLFKNLVVNYASSWDPYAVDTLGHDIKEFQFQKNKQLFRQNSTQWEFGLDWALQSKTKKKDIVSNKATQEELDNIKKHKDDYVDFDQPWNLNIQYVLSFTNTFNQATSTMRRDVTHTIGIKGDINIAAKWKVGFVSNYDIKNKELSYTSLNIYRDLHCWEMTFSWIPTGSQKSYNLTIRVKSAVLQDLKLTKKKSPWDN